MSRLLTFQEARASRLVEVAQVCATSEEFRQLLNEVTERILLRGDWPGVLVPMAFCLRSGCVTWPRIVGNIRGAKMGCRQVHVSNAWGYGFLDGASSWSRQWANCGGHDVTLINIGHAATYEDIKGENKKVRFYIDCLEDVGKEIVLRDFIDSNGQPLKEKVDGVWKYQKTLTLANQYVSTSEDIRTFGRVHLPDDLQCRVRVFAYDTVDDTLRDLAVYDPGETDPWYARSQIKGSCSGFSCNESCSGITNFVALVKLQFVPIVNDDDLVPIANIGALKHGFQAVRMEESDNDAGAVAKWALAVKELNLQLRDESPDWTVPTQMRPFNGRRYTNSCV